MSTHRPELERILVDTWAARDVGMRELNGGMSELRVVLPTADAIAAHDRLDPRAEQLRREQQAAASLPSPDPIGCLRDSSWRKAPVPFIPTVGGVAEVLPYAARGAGRRPQR